MAHYSCTTYASDIWTIFDEHASVKQRSKGRMYHFIDKDVITVIFNLICRIVVFFCEERLHRELEAPCRQSATFFAL